jgi:hypothetical protein
MTINIENKPRVSKRLVGDIIILIECLIAAASQETPDFAGFGMSVGRSMPVDGKVYWQEGLGTQFESAGWNGN